MELILKLKMNLKKLFIHHCKTKGLEINNNQIITIKIINEFIKIILIIIFLKIYF